jgi:hypothetical protein
MESILKVNAPAVVAEIIDGEAVIMDLASGHYFSTRHVGCDIWRGVERGLTRSSIARTLVARYEVDESAAGAAVDMFVRDLLERNLVVEVSASAGNGDAPEAESAAARRRDFAPPVLEAYSDMEEMLLLDPIHDVDAAGWPMPKSDAAD